MKGKKNTPSVYATSILFAFSFLTASSYVFVRALAVSLFIARAGTQNLPIAFAVSAFFVIVVSLLTRWAVGRLKTKLAASTTWLLLSLLTISIGVLLGTLHHSLIALSTIYVFAEIRGCLNTIYVVTFSNDYFADKDTKQPYTTVASGAPIAGILVGAILGYEASVVSLAPAIVVIVALDIAAAISAWLLPSRNAVRLKRNLDADIESEALKLAKSTDGATIENKRRPNKYQFSLAILVSLKIVVLTLIGYQWKVSVGDYFGSDETRLLAYFAIFYATSDVLIVLLQWLVAGKVIDRMGIGLWLVGFPIAVAVVAVAVFFVDSTFAMLVVFTLGRGLNVVRRALHDPGLTVAYTVIDPKFRRETIVFVKGMVKPFAEAFTAGLLLIVGGLVLEIWITGIWFLLTLPWLYFAFRDAKLYRRRQQSSRLPHRPTHKSDTIEAVNLTVP